MPAPTTPVGDFADIIRDRTQYFSGRGWVFRAVDEWLRNPNGKRVFLLCGGPGTGKTAVAARIAQASLGEVAIAESPALQPAFLTYLHFCQAGRDSTLSPSTFVQSLSQALANRVPGFREALERQGSQQIVINAPVEVKGDVAAGARVGSEIGQIRIEIRGADARPMFDDAVRRPLKTVAASAPLGPIVVLVDSLDEALTFSGNTNIVRLLQLVNDFPPEVRFLLTSRSNSERVIDLLGPASLDLIADAPAAEDEVGTYAGIRLASVPEPPRAELAGRVAKQSGGNFLYAFHVLNDLVARATAPANVETIELPVGLEGVYRSFLERDLAADDERWRTEVRPLLGAIVVARGDGLTREQLLGINPQLSEERLDDLLRLSSEYLAGGSAGGGTLRIYHQSFREFLLDDPKYQVYPAARHQAIAVFLLKKYGKTLGKNADEYALRHTPIHLAEAARGPESARDGLVRQLIELTGDAGYQDRCDVRLRDIPMLNEHMTRAVAAAALCESDDMLPWLARAGLDLAAFRERFLQGASVIALAEQGDTASAEARLPLFAGLDRDWQTAASLIIAWLALNPNATAADDIVARVAKTPLQELPLRILLERVQAAVAGQTSFHFDPGAPGSIEAAQQRVRRMSGQEADLELLHASSPSLAEQSELISGRGYAATLDGPVLVATARESGEAGTALLDQYVDAHAGYNYVEYRNKSLWVTLHAVLRHHPSQEWVLDRLERILSVALQSGGAEFVESAPLNAAVLLERARTAGARGVVDAYGNEARALVGRLQAERGANDSWSLHRRRLIARLEVEALALANKPGALQALSEIRELEHRDVLVGFAGFQAPSMTRFADALLASRITDAREVMATAAMSVKIAHRIQDFRFCARMTARCQTLKRWHETPLTSADLERTVDHFATAPDDREFAAYHVIGDAYRYRNHSSPETLPIREAQQANTLERLADVFQRSAVAFVRLNPTYGLDTPIPDGTTVEVPDPGLVPLLAVHFAARALGEPALAGRTGPLVRRLVPLAGANATAFDGMLAYLLIASKLDDVATLEALTDTLGPPVPRDPKRPTGGVLRNAAIPA